MTVSVVLSCCVFCCRLFLMMWDINYSDDCHKWIKCDQIGDSNALAGVSVYMRVCACVCVCVHALRKSIFTLKQFCVMLWCIFNGHWFWHRWQMVLSSEISLQTSALNVCVCVCVCVRVCVSAWFVSKWLFTALTLSFEKNGGKKKRIRHI